ncbi:hypothetical protein PISL3812_06184 [Talaromyces islandicus]|uniref:Starter acyltransferase (SAT) domain-containing protein n=1 Tax=Talaromyces islandicus TaxID=28573 RepID=A0A0U1M0P5_TALIS|nr:hypothetical protein PISL3812_06184 [Talaromyces islandicus]
MSVPDILLFGDQTETDFKVEELFNYAQESTRLQSFIEGALKSVHQAFSEADLPNRQKYAFDSFLSLEERILAEKVPDVVLRTVLLCFAQLGHLILRLETDVQAHELWKSQKFTIVASCAGQIPATLAAITESLDDLVDAAPEIVATAVRAGLDVDQRTNDFNDDRSKSWATAVGVPLAEAQQVTATFNKNKGLIPSKGLYCGVTSAWATTIIGPPRLQEELFASKPFGEARVTPLPINATFHALNADRPDVESIIGSVPKIEKLKLENACFLSCEDGAIFPPQNGKELLSQALLNILNRITDNEKVFAQVRVQTGDKEASIVPVVADKVAARLIKVLGEDKAHVKTN